MGRVLNSGARVVPGARGRAALRQLSSIAAPVLALLPIALLLMSAAAWFPSRAAGAPAGDASLGGGPSARTSETPVNVMFAALARDGEPPPSRMPASPGGIRIWSDGDSVSYFMTTNLFSLLADRGAVPVRAADYKISARLADPSGYSAVLGVRYSWWPTYLPAEMARYDPDVVVLMVGTNDAVFVDPELYRQRAAETMDLFRDGERLLVWVGIPSLLRADLAANAPALNSVASAEAASRYWVVFVDTTGIYPDGADGVHFSSVRGRQLAEAVIDAVFPGLLGSAPAGGSR